MFDTYSLLQPQDTLSPELLWNTDQTMNTPEQLFSRLDSTVPVSSNTGSFNGLTTAPMAVHTPPRMDTDSMDHDMSPSSSFYSAHESSHLDLSILDVAAKDKSSQVTKVPSIENLYPIRPQQQQHQQQQRQDYPGNPTSEYIPLDSWYSHNSPASLSTTSLQSSTSLNDISYKNDIGSFDADDKTLTPLTTVSMDTLTTLSAATESSLYSSLQENAMFDSPVSLNQTSTSNYAQYGTPPYNDSSSVYNQIFQTQSHLSNNLSNSVGSLDCHTGGLEGVKYRNNPNKTKRPPSYEEHVYRALALKSQGGSYRVDTASAPARIDVNCSNFTAQPTLEFRSTVDHRPTVAEPECNVNDPVIYNQIVANAQIILKAVTGGGQIQLWQFLLELLADQEYKSMIVWESADGEFRVIEPDELAQKWGSRETPCKPDLFFKLFNIQCPERFSGTVRRLGQHKSV
ncbi:unnamed protein product [Owenia fusiformis]|uniref:Uncharacterized protein n=1 Tax=Owenia fusiformis TaxID=6347 RepID=A0A8J1THD9_OWEFU|nr:unnamed protein product [Owenia fusiformis]